MDYKRPIKIKNQCVFTYVVVVSHVRFGGPVVVHLKRSISDSLAERVGVKKKKNEAKNSPVQSGTYSVQTFPRECD